MKSNVLVLMSSYNGESYIEEQIESILAQEGCNVRLLVRDDGSTDGTRKILEKYSTNGKLRYIAGENKGPARSFLSLVIDSEDADYYAFADQDDIWDSVKIIRGIGKLPISDRPALYCSNLNQINSESIVLQEKILPTEIPTDFAEVATGTGYLFGCTMVFNKAMKKYIESHGMPEYLIMHDIWLGMIASLFGNLIYDSNSYIAYRVHNDNFTLLDRKENIFLKLKGAATDSKYSFSKQYESFANYMELSRLPKKDSICESMLTYRRKLWDKIRLILYILSKKKLSLKRKIYYCIQIIFNKF